MNFKNWSIAIICASVFSACNNNADKTDTTDTTTTTTGTTIDNTGTTNTTTITVPEPLRTSFQAKYPNATSVNWSRYQPIDRFDWTWTGWPTLDTSDYVVTYNDNGVDYWAWYDENNNWIGSTTMVKDHSSLPAAVNKAWQAEFSDYTVTSVEKENDKNRTAYEIKLNKGSDWAKLLVDENGKVMKKVTSKDGVKTKEKTDKDSM